MDTGLIKPAARTVRTGLPTSRANVAPATAPTELPGSQSVTTAADAARGAHDRTMRNDLAHRTAGEILMDPQICEVISRAASPRPGRLPAKDAALKLRAYRRTATDDEPDTQSLEKTA